MTRNLAPAAVFALSALIVAAALAVTAGPERSAPALAVKRSMPNGRTDVIKVMGNTRW